MEIREDVGPENFFLFGLTAQEVMAKKAEGYRPYEHYQSDPELREAIDLLRAGFFSRGDQNLFADMLNNLLDRDEFMLLADFKSYMECQEKTSAAYADEDNWARMSILNTARMGRFSSDRAIKEYCDDIWHVQPVRVQMNIVKR